MAIETFQFDGESLGLSQLATLAHGGPAVVGLTPAARLRVVHGRKIVEAALAAGQTHYGINTGVGAQKTVRIDPADFAAFNRRIIIAEATNMPGPAFAPTVVRGALAVLINNAATGRLGIRPALVDRLLALFAAPHLPEIRCGTSGGASDLNPLSQLACAVIGDADSGPLDLAAKEAVSLINSNAFFLAHAAIVLAEASRLAETFDLATALSLEGFRGNLGYLRHGFEPAIRNPWQLASARRIAAGLDGSALWSPTEWRNLQDPVSFRFAQRVNGTIESAVNFTAAQLCDDVNAVCDNPVVSLELGELVTGVNMDSTPLTAGFDMLRQSLAMAASVSTERSLKQQHAGFSGLPVGLSSPDHARAGGGLAALILAHLATARQAAMRGLAAPVLLDSAHAVADGIVDVAGSGPLSAQRTAEVAELCWQILTIEIVTALWALKLRAIGPESIGTPLRKLATEITPHLPIGHEGKAVFDLVPLIDIVRRICPGPERLKQQG